MLDHRTQREGELVGRYDTESKSRVERHVPWHITESRQGFFTLLISFGWTFVVQQMKIHFYERPKAALVFTGGDTTVFAQPGDVTLPISDGRHPIRMRQTKYHVGLVNKSGMTLNRLRLVLDKVTPHVDHVVYKGKPMEIRCEIAPDGYIDLPPSDGTTPSRYVAFLWRN